MGKSHFLDTRITFLKGVGDFRAELFKKELGFFRFRDLLYAFPSRYVDRSSFLAIRDLANVQTAAQTKGILTNIREEGQGRRARLHATLRDETGSINLIWFQGVKWVRDKLVPNSAYICYGKPNIFQNKLQIAHPDLELLDSNSSKERLALHPVYPSTEKLNAKGLDGKHRVKMIEDLLSKLRPEHITENIPEYLLKNQGLIGRYHALRAIHLPRDYEELERAKQRLKFEELFFIQLDLMKKNVGRKQLDHGYRFGNVGVNFRKFYETVLPFELTEAQKRVMKEIRKDCGSGYQMNRLLQGDVGSGKTIVAFMTILLAIDNGYQACLMAPTEILAHQHYQRLKELSEKLEVRVEFLSGSVKGKKRETLLSALKAGEIDLLCGTHALIEDPVQYANLGLAITDEQHRFGVAQRAKLWRKAKNGAPHILVMTATPIPRTLAMTSFGDLDVSVIDELPPGRKLITTVHKRESQRSQIISFMHSEIKKGRQIYVVYPLIEESEKLDLQDLNQGYERLLDFFPRPDFQIGVIHGRMKPDDKDMEMARFVKGVTQILVATTVIEVGVNVPNASVMIIENAERFGLSQLHQLRGRVGRGSEQSYCILVSGFKLSKEGKKRIETMCSTNDGFVISQVDLELRGPGNIRGTQQSGILALKIADLIEDHEMLAHVRSIARKILERDPKLESSHNTPLIDQLNKMGDNFVIWSKIA